MNWERKIAALMHDPLTKAYDIVNHENEARALLGILDIPYQRGKEDHIASEMDRIPLPFQVRGKKIIVPLEDLKGFKHPLSASLLKILDKDLLPDHDNAFRTLKDNLRKIKESNPENERLFHALWWHLPDLIDMASFLPADTRYPNHSIVDHLEATSALAGCIEGKLIKASLISVSIGPVQSFIAAARKTKDLWAGSYLLSLLIYAGIEYIGQNYGFDSIVFPSVRNTSFVKDSLKEWDVNLIDEFQKLPNPTKKVASLPNRFVAIVPESETAPVLKNIENVIKERWKNIANEALTKLRTQDAIIDDSYLEEQLNSFPEIYTTSQKILYPYEIKDVIDDFYFDNEIDEDMNFLKKIAKECGGYTPDAGAFYNYTYRLLRSKMDAVKAIRPFKYFKDASMHNGKMLDGDSLAGDMKAIVEIKDVEKIDKLSTINAIKRTYAENIKFPSVDELKDKNEYGLKKVFPEIYEEMSSFKNSYFAILIMDGDRMGKWVSGSNAPEVKEILEGTITNDALKKLPEDIKEWLFNRKIVNPSYHRSISRTLNIFSTIVEHIVKAYGGELVYSGGDDVLAFLPATSVLQCANQIRKVYSGVGGITFQVNGKKYLFKDEILWINKIPYATMMGRTATMSAGIAVVNHKFPLRSALEIARSSEKRAKDFYGRNSFEISVVRRSGQITSLGSEWDINNFDVISELTDLINVLHKEKVSMRSLRKLETSYSKEEGLFLEKKEILEHYIAYVLKKSEIGGNREIVKEKLKDFYKIFFSAEDKKWMCIYLPLYLILIQEFLLRGDER
ncbi:hypothetical protein DU53_02535 [Kosmotoga sp. DU53]|nr:hypothetical protein DU53_02535 [Kosmotoga sp. DU53]